MQFGAAFGRSLLARVGLLVALVAIVGVAEIATMGAQARADFFASTAMSFVITFALIPAAAALATGGLVGWLAYSRGAFAWTAVATFFVVGVYMMKITMFA
jgi:hypothetical protein